MLYTVVTVLAVAAVVFADVDRGICCIFASLGSATLCFTFCFQKPLRARIQPVLPSLARTRLYLRRSIVACIVNYIFLEGQEVLEN